MRHFIKPFLVLALVPALGGCAFLQRLMPAEPDVATRSASAEWRAHVSPDIPYYNMDATPVPVFSDQALTRPAGAFARGEGGYVETCLTGEPVCRIAQPGSDSVWVRITALSGVSG